MTTNCGDPLEKCGFNNNKCILTMVPKQFTDDGKFYTEAPSIIYYSADFSMHFPSKNFSIGSKNLSMASKNFSIAGCLGVQNLDKNRLIALLNDHFNDHF